MPNRPNTKRAGLAKAELFEPQNRVRDLELHLRARDERVGELEHQLGNRYQRIGELNQQIIDSHKELYLCQETIRARERRITILEGEFNNFSQIIIEKDEKISYLEKNLHALLASTTWRMTAPLRLFLNKLPRSRRSILRRVAKFLYWIVTPHLLPQRLKFIQNRNRAGVAPEDSTRLASQDDEQGGHHSRERKR